MSSSTPTRPTNRGGKRPTNQPTATAFGYVSGWHNGPTPERCSGTSENPNGSIVACTHPSHTEPEPEPEPAAAVSVTIDAQPVHGAVHGAAARDGHLPDYLTPGLQPVVEGQLLTPTGRALPYAAPGTPQWFEQRRGGVTATDLPKLFGISRYGGPLHVWSDKLGRVPSDDAGEAALWGHLLEDVVAEEWARRQGVRVSVLGVLEHRDHPWQRASLDRLVLGCPDTGPSEACALEVKTRSAFVAGRWREQIPDDVYLQTAWQRLVAGVPHVHVAVLIGGQRLELHRYDPDPDLEQQCLEVAGELWAQVLAQEPPVVEPDDLLLDLLERLHSTREGAVEIPGDRLEEVQRLLTQRRDALAAAKSASEAADVAKAGLVQLLGAGEVATIDGVEAYRYRPSTTRRTAWREVVKAAPSAWREDLQQLVAAHTTVSTSRSLILPDLTPTPTEKSA